uniref:Uncharacterized protein n=1 Tax=Myoviridae sp. ctOAa14 TaxID=2826646 RepID=A0A8S5MRD9_9CAUD|nr:MAG TPA: hypothetical protein [Myoviridae sp. ctOAa14]
MLPFTNSSELKTGSLTAARLSGRLDHVGAP